MPSAFRTRVGLERLSLELFHRYSERRLGSLIKTRTVPYRIMPPLGSRHGTAEVGLNGFIKRTRGACVEFCSPCKTIKKAAGGVHTAPLIKISKFKEFKGWKEEVMTLITLIFQIVKTTWG